MAMKELIQITSLLNRSIMLLMNEVHNKEKHIESLQKTRTDITPNFQEWLLEKTQHEYETLLAFICTCDKYIDLADCSKEEQVEYTEAQKKAIELILTNDKVCAKLVALSEQVTISNPT